MSHQTWIERGLILFVLLLAVAALVVNFGLPYPTAGGFMAAP